MTLEMKKKTPVTKAAGTSPLSACDRKSQPPPTIAPTATRSSIAESKPAAAAIFLLAAFCLLVGHSLEPLKEGGLSES